jgi:hypothetical protein
MQYLFHGLLIDLLSQLAAKLTHVETTEDLKLAEAILEK